MQKYSQKTSKKITEYYAEYDEDTALYCVFDNNGFAHSS